MSHFFLKFHTHGNDFLIFPHKEAPVPWFTDMQCKSIASRRHGLGCDQVLQVDAVENRGARPVKIHNQDGSLAYACGNGMRCLVQAMHIIYHQEKEQEFLVEGQSIQGFITPHKLICVQQGQGTVVRTGSFQGYPLWYVDIRNTHVIVAVETEDFHEHTLSSWAKSLCAEYNANISFITYTSKDYIDAWVWERGVGPSLCCGSAACAIACALDVKCCTIRMVGGELGVFYCPLKGWCHEGPATFVAKGWCQI